MTVYLNEHLFKMAQERSVNMLRAISTDGRGGSLTEHYLAVALLAMVLEGRLRRHHGEAAEPMMDATLNWLKTMFNGTSEAEVTQEFPTVPTVGKNTIGKCSSPGCAKSCRGSFCRSHGGPA